MLTIDVERTDDVVVVRCLGRIVRGEAVGILRGAVVSERDTRIVVLDLSEVEAIDAGGLTALVSLHHWTRGRGIQLKLVNPSLFVMETLQRTGLDGVFDISSLHDALVVLGATQESAFHHAAC
jgi:anti-anti-sigma factor